MVIFSKEKIQEQETHYMVSARQELDSLMFYKMVLTPQNKLL